MEGLIEKHEYICSPFRRLCTFTQINPQFSNYSGGMGKFLIVFPNQLSFRHSTKWQQQKYYWGFTYSLGRHWSNSFLHSLCGPNSTRTFYFYSAAIVLPIIWTKTMLLIPLNGLLAPATNLHSRKLFIEFMCHLGDLQTAGVTPGAAVTSDGTLPEPQLACVLSQMWKALRLSTSGLPQLPAQHSESETSYLLQILAAFTVHFFDVGFLYSPNAFGI